MSIRKTELGLYWVVEERWQDAPDGTPIRLLAFRFQGRDGNWQPWHKVQEPLELEP